jgi:bifunctional non-homologous end joining protein LigD
MINSYFNSTAFCFALIAGFALKQNKFDGIYVGRLKGKDLVYAGKVDDGFDKTSAADL